MSKFIDQRTEIRPKIHKKRLHKIKWAVFPKSQNKTTGRSYTLAVVMSQKRWKDTEIFLIYGLEILCVVCIKTKIDPKFPSPK